MNPYLKNDRKIIVGSFVITGLSIIRRLADLVSV